MNPINPEVKYQIRENLRDFCLQKNRSNVIRYFIKEADKNLDNKIEKSEFYKFVVYLYKEVLDLQSPFELPTKEEVNDYFDGKEKEHRDYFTLAEFEFVFYDLIRNIRDVLSDVYHPYLNLKPLK